MSVIHLDRVAAQGKVERLGGGESPTDAVLSDLPLALAIVIWVGVCVVALLP